MAFISKLILLQTGRENDVGGIAVVCQKQKQDVHQRPPQEELPV